MLDRWLLGRLGEDPLEEMAQRAGEFLRWGAEKPPECIRCRWRSLCNGGCKNDWLPGPEAHNYFCPAFQRFFAYAQERLTAIARAEARARSR